jgi:putative transposase
VSQTERKIILEEQKMDTQSLTHTKWECQYHIVFIPKYRQKRLYGKIRADVKEIIKTLCKYKGVDIMEGAVCIDHIHLHVSIPPKISISDFMSYLKGKSALMLYDKHPRERSKWDKSFWARGYYVSTIGTISEETIKKYIKEQSERDRKEDNGSDI